MKLSKNGIKVLTAQYRAVLRKCLLINMGLFITFSANATEFSSNNSYVLTSPESLNFSGLENVTISDSTLTDTNLNFTFKDSKNIKIENSDLETSKGNVELTHTSFSYTCIDCYKENKDDPEESYSKYILGNDVKINNSEVTLGKRGETDDFARISANNKLDINGSTVTMSGSSALVYEGTDADNGAGAVNISGSNITLNDKAALWVGEPGWWLGQENSNEATAPLTISKSNITLYKDSSINFAGNGADTIIKEKSTITMNDRSSMKLNKLVLEDSVIEITGEENTKDGTARLEVTDVKLTNSSILGKNNIIDFSGEVEFSGFFDPAVANVNGKLTREGYSDEITYNINKGGTLTFKADKDLYDSDKHGSEYKMNALNFNGGELDLRNDKASEIKLSSLTLSSSSNIYLDADLANNEMDTLSSENVSGNAQLNVAGLKIISDAKDDMIRINFTENETLKKAVNYANSTIKGYSPIYSYDVAYNDGDFTFTRGGGSSVSDYNPAVYAGSVVGQTLATIQSTINQTAFSSLNNTLPQKDNAWVSVIGFDDTVDMKSFKNVDSEMYSVVGGVNSDAKRFDNFDATYGLYAGYINSEQKYDGNKIEQNGGYIGLDSVLTKGSAELLAGVNTGYIRNEDKHSFGNDKFDTYFTGVAVKAGYTYDLNNGLSVVPNLYAGYTFVNNEDYTSKSGVKIKNDNLHLFEVAPGVKVNKDFNNGWTGYAQAKYAFITDNGGDADVNNINLPNISAKDYVEYGLGANKALSEAWSLSAEINRRDGGREGWNGNLNVKYNF